MKKPEEEEEFTDEEFEFLFPSEISGDRSFPITSRFKRRRHKAGAAGASIVLSNNTTTDSAAIGSDVGTFFVQGSSDVFSFSLLSDPGGFYTLVGPILRVAAAPAVGFEVIVVKADNGTGQVLIQPFLIFVTHVVAGYVPTYELLGF